MGPPDNIPILGIKDDRIAFAFCHILDLIHNLAEDLGGIGHKSLLLLQLFILLVNKLLKIVSEGCNLIIYIIGGIVEMTSGLNI